ncbi:hypothetical protein DUT91_12290 [Phyllobacterium salinisoli]|uniref:Uncharacterized protein n=1 Tax=Phyllobacterium salinisoli TaxID=1899321 RepID=A0A368K1L9_9HYPH|nr:hypothetical protein [Phyllobacterium salinisoli]RCS23101.1 hypothetical protein DUT91_12290 [Phyllobacterium salinisoli]
MMVAVFALLSLALVLGWFGRRSIAMLCIFLCLAVALKEFLWEIHSSTYGYRMPWIQTRHMDTPPVAQHVLAYHSITHSTVQTRGGLL